MKRRFRTIYRIARENAKMTQETAAELLGISPRWLLEYEAGRAIPSDAIVAKMVEVYDAPWLAYQHLKENSELGRRYLPDINISDLAKAVLKFKKEIRDLEEIDDEMIEIACDGTIDDDEKKRWRKIEKEVDEIISAAFALIFAETGQKEKALMERAV